MFCQTLGQRMRRLMYPEHSTRLPFSILLVVFVVALTSSWTYIMVSSFIPKLVHWFGVSNFGVGFNVGMIDSSGSIGSFISSLIWGYLSDKKGKRYCILATSICCVATAIGFGFSQGLWWAVIMKFLVGLSLGQVIVLKGLLKEVCDETNIAIGMSVLLTAPAVGSIIGPSLGGYTAFPHDLYPKVFTKRSLFAQFPALLPNLIIATGLGVGIALTVLLLPRDGKQKIESCEGGNQLLQVSIYGSFDSSSDSTNSSSEKLSIISRDNENDNAIDIKYSSNNNRNSSACSRIYNSVKQSGMIKVLQRRECLLCCLLVMLFASSEIGFKEILPIFASTDLNYKGIGLEPSDLGLLLTVVSSVQIIFQLTLVPKLSVYFGPQKCFIASNIVQALFCPLLPAFALLHNKTVMWIGLVVVIFVLNTSVITGYLSIDILINNSVDVDIIGSALGVTMIASHLGRFAARIACGGIYSWSLTNIKGVQGNANPLGFPFDQFLSFFVMSLSSVICAVLTTKLPTRTSQDGSGN